MLLFHERSPFHLHPMWRPAWLQLPPFARCPAQAPVRLRKLGSQKEPRVSDVAKARCKGQPANAKNLPEICMQSSFLHLPAQSGRSWECGEWVSPLWIPTALCDSGFLETGSVAGADRRTGRPIWSGDSTSNDQSLAKGMAFLACTIRRVERNLLQDRQFLFVHLMPASQHAHTVGALDGQQVDNSDAHIGQAECGPPMP